MIFKNKIIDKEKINTFSFQIYSHGPNYLLDLMDDFFMEELVYNADTMENTQGLLGSSLDNKIDLDEKVESISTNSIREEIKTNDFKSIAEILSQSSDGPEMPKYSSDYKDIIKFTGKLGEVGFLGIENGEWKNKFSQDDLSILFLGDPIEDSSVESKLDFESDWMVLLNKIIKATKLPENKFGLINFLNPEDKFLQDSQKLGLFIALHRPRFIVPLGANAYKFLTQSRERLSNIHGKITSFSIVANDSEPIEVKICPTFHPQYILINPNIKKTVWGDFQNIIKSFV